MQQPVLIVHNYPNNWNIHSRIVNNDGEKITLRTAYTRHRPAIVPATLHSSNAQTRLALRTWRERLPASGDFLIKKLFVFRLVRSFCACSFAVPLLCTNKIIIIMRQSFAQRLTLLYYYGGDGDSRNSTAQATQCSSCYNGAHSFSTVPPTLLFQHNSHNHHSSYFRRCLSQTHILFFSISFPLSHFRGTIPLWNALWFCKIHFNATASAAAFNAEFPFRQSIRIRAKSLRTRPHFHCRALWALSACLCCRVRRAAGPITAGLVPPTMLACAKHTSSPIVSF